jgi:hypothetical protein
MINKLYKKIFVTYYLSVFILVTIIGLLILQHNYSTSKTHHQSLSQSYVNNIILQLQNDIAVSDAIYEQYDSNIPMNLVIISENVTTSFISDEIKTPHNELEVIMQKQFQRLFMINNPNEADETKMLSHLLPFNTKGLYGEIFNCTFFSFISVSGKKYELYAACLINKNILSLQQICRLGILELFLLISFWGLGKHIIHASIVPINETMQSQKEFIASASHELKTPLSKIVIANGSTLLNNRDKIINKECERMDKIIKDLLFIASSESCTWKTNFEYVDFINLCIEFYEVSMPVIMKGGKELQLDFPDDVRPIYIDRALIMQLLAILLDNAITYSGENKLITIRLVQQKKNLSVHFIDYGIGISDENKQKIFSRFYKINASTPEHYGLGLSIAQNIVELHHGKITVSDTPGGGATFTIILPY